MLLDRPHHDGSEPYVLDRPEELGGSATVRLRVPHATQVDDVALRAVRDGEPRVVRAKLDEETETDTWYSATFTVDNPTTRYRWLLARGTVGYAWLNGLGLIPYDVADADDFVLTTDPGGPEWHLGSVVYEVFPDRFASTGIAVDDPVWAVRRKWDERRGLVRACRSTARRRRGAPLARPGRARARDANRGRPDAQSQRRRARVVRERARLLLFRRDAPRRRSRRCWAVTRPLLRASRPCRATARRSTSGGSIAKS